MGAKIKITVNGKGGTQRQICATVGTGGSFGSQSIRQEIGLGDATGIVKIEVQWPRTGVPNTVYQHIRMDSQVRLTEGIQQPEEVALEVFSLKK